MKPDGTSQEAAVQGGLQRLSSQELKKLIRRAQKGSNEAFCELYQSYLSLILFHVNERISHPEDAEDVAQEVVIQMWRSIKKLQSPHAFYNWMLRIIINMCANYRNRAGKKKDLEYNGYDDDTFGDLMDTDVSERDTLGQSESSPEEQDWLYAQITQLPQAQRECVTLYFLDNQSYQEIADLLGVTIGTVSSNISKAKKTLMARHEEERAESEGSGALDLAAALPLALNRQVARVATQAVREQFIKAMNSQLKGVPQLVAKGASLSKLAGLFSVSMAALLAIGAAVHFMPKTKSDTGTPESTASPAPNTTAPAEAQGVINIEWSGDASSSSATDAAAPTAQSPGGSRPKEISVRLFSSSTQVSGWYLTATTGPVAIKGSGESVDSGTLASLAPGSYRITWTLKNAAGATTQLSRTFQF